MLSQQRKRFCLEYASGKNGTEAYKAAGYNVKSDDSARTLAARLLHNPEIQAELRRLSSEIESKKIMNVEEMQQRLTSIARQEATEEITVQGKIVKRKAGFRTALSAMELLARIQGNFAPDKQQIDISGTMPVVLVDDVKDDDSS